MWVCDADGSNAVQFTATGAEGTSTPNWSPDGEQITFACNAEGQYEVYVVGAGGGKPRRLTNRLAVDQDPSWSRDGKWVYFRSPSAGSDQIWKLPAGPESTPSEPVQVTRNGGNVAFESPDGKWLYYSNTPPGGLWRMPVEGGQEERLLEGVDRYAWGVTNEGVYYMPPTPSTRPNHLIQFLDLTTRKITLITRTEKPTGAGLTVSPDRHWLLFQQVDQEGRDLMLVENFR